MPSASFARILPWAVLLLGSLLTGACGQNDSRHESPTGGSSGGSAGSSDRSSGGAKAGTTSGGATAQGSGGSPNLGGSSVGGAPVAGGLGGAGSSGIAGAAGSAGTGGAGATSQIRVRFLGFANGQELIAGTFEHAGCERVPSLTDPSRLRFTECFAQRVVELFNREFETLIGVRPFVFHSLEIQASSPLATLVTAPEEDGVTFPEVLRPHILPGVLNVLMPQNLEGPSGFAGGDAVLHAERGAFLAAEPDTGEGVFMHEFGHVLGIPHVLKSPSWMYPHCGGFDIPRPTGCACDISWMWGYVPYATNPSCAPCPDAFPPSTYDTPHYGASVAHVARCWYEQRRLRQACQHEVDPAARAHVVCQGQAGELTCTCPGLNKTFPAATCQPAELQSAYETQCVSGECAIADRPELVCRDYGQGIASCGCSKGAPETATNCAALRARSQTLCVEAEDCAETFRGGDSRYECAATTSGYTCACPRGGPSFSVPSCAPGAKAERDAAAAAACGVITCAVPDRPDVICEALGSDDQVQCRCPAGQLFYVEPDCGGAENTTWINGACAG